MAGAEDTKAAAAQIATPEGKPPPTAAAAAEEEVVSVELPAPEGWSKKFIPRKGGTPRRNEIVFISPTGEEIRNKKQLDQYLRSHSGGSSSSEFDWGSGDTPRRSARISEKAKATESPEVEPPKKKERKSSSKKGAKEKKEVGDGDDQAPEETDMTVLETKDATDMEMQEAEDATNQSEKVDVAQESAADESTVEKNPDDKPEGEEAKAEEKNIDEPKQEEMEIKEKLVDEPSEEVAKSKLKDADETNVEEATRQEKEVKTEDKNITEAASKVVPVASLLKVDELKDMAGKEDVANSGLPYPPELNEVASTPVEKEVKDEDVKLINGSNQDEWESSISKEVLSRDCNDPQQQPKSSPVSS